MPNEIDPADEVTSFLVGERSELSLDGFKTMIKERFDDDKFMQSFIKEFHDQLKGLERQSTSQFGRVIAENRLTLYRDKIHQEAEARLGISHSSVDLGWFLVPYILFFAASLYYG